MTYKQYLEKIYYDQRHPGSLGGVDKLYKAERKEGKYVMAKIRKWLKTEETSCLNRQIVRSFRRRKVVAPFVDYQWDTATAVIISYAKENDGKLLSTAHRRLFPFRAHMSAKNDPRNRNGLGSADVFLTPEGHPLK